MGGGAIMANGLTPEEEAELNSDGLTPEERAELSGGVKTVIYHPPKGKPAALAIDIGVVEPTGQMPASNGKRPDPIAQPIRARPKVLDTASEQAADKAELEAIMAETVPDNADPLTKQALNHKKAQYLLGYKNKYPDFPEEEQKRGDKRSFMTSVGTGAAAQGVGNAFGQMEGVRDALLQRAGYLGAGGPKSNEMGGAPSFLGTVAKAAYNTVMDPDAAARTAGTYGEAVNRTREEQGAAFKDHPVGYTLGAAGMGALQIAGAPAAGVGTAGMTGIGAGIGGLSGIAGTERLTQGENNLGETATSGVVGGLLGGAGARFPAATSAAMLGSGLASKYGNFDIPFIAETPEEKDALIASGGIGLIPAAVGAAGIAARNRATGTAKQYSLPQERIAGLAAERVIAADLRSRYEAEVSKFQKAKAAGLNPSPNAVVKAEAEYAAFERSKSAKIANEARNAGNYLAQQRPFADVSKLSPEHLGALKASPEEIARRVSTYMEPGATTPEEHARLKVGRETADQEALLKANIERAKNPPAEEPVLVKEYEPALSEAERAILEKNARLSQEDYMKGSKDVRIPTPEEAIAAKRSSVAKYIKDSVAAKKAAGYPGEELMSLATNRTKKIGQLLGFTNEPSDFKQAVAAENLRQKTDKLHPEKLQSASRGVGLAKKEDASDANDFIEWLKQQGGK